MGHNLSILRCNSKCFRCCIGISGTTRKDISSISRKVSCFVIDLHMKRW
jgi:hypothetical protein